MAAGRVAQQRLERELQVHGVTLRHGVDAELLAGLPPPSRTAIGSFVSGLMLQATQAPNG